MEVAISWMLRGSGVFRDGRRAWWVRDEVDDVGVSELGARGGLMGAFQAALQWSIRAASAETEGAGLAFRRGAAACPIPRRLWRRLEETGQGGRGGPTAWMCRGGKTGSCGVGSLHPWVAGVVQWWLWVQWKLRKDRMGMVSSRGSGNGIGAGTDGWADHSATYFVNGRGQRIFSQQWMPIGIKPRGLVFMIHGLNGHSSRYWEVAKEFVDAGFGVFAHDLHGHGRSEGFRAYTASMQHYVDDARLFVSNVQRKFKRANNIPRFMVAHSLGGAIAVRLTRDEEDSWNGVILCAPALKVYPNPIAKIFAPVLAKVVPFMQVQKLRARSNFSSRSEKSSLEDPLLLRKAVRARVGYELLRNSEDVMSRATLYKVPLYLVHSKGDRVTDPKGSEYFFNRILSIDKTLRLYEGSTHDLLGSFRHREPIVREMVEWTNARLEGSKRRPRRKPRDETARIDQIAIMSQRA